MRRGREIYEAFTGEAELSVVVVLGLRCRVYEVLQQRRTDETRRDEMMLGLPDRA